MKGVDLYDHINIIGTRNIDRFNYASGMRMDCNHPAAGYINRRINNCGSCEVNTRQEEITT